MQGQREDIGGINENKAPARIVSPSSKYDGKYPETTHYGAIVRRTWGFPHDVTSGASQTKRHRR